MGRNLTKHLGFVVTLMFLMTLTGSSIDNRNLQNSFTTKDVINITVGEAWELLSDISNGIQIPIDVRTEEEWRSERINTPYPEYPRHYNLYDLQENHTLLQNLMSTYNGMELILYCKSGGRSSIAANLLSCSGFNGTIYNMLGGITEWKNTGLPTKTGNTSPNQPTQPKGPVVGEENILLNYSCNATDSDNDVIRYGWDWDGDDNVEEWTDYYPSEVTVALTHSWTKAGRYNIKVMVEDFVGDKSGFSPSLNVTITPENPPEIKIIDPTKAVYLKNHKIIPFPVTVVIGSITIKADVFRGEAEKVEFYVDNKLKETVYNEPYSWVWSETTFGKHVVKTVAYDIVENQASDEITVWKLF
ncbi:MAG TPA: hypothetical protein ENL13_05240 [Thermoplasmatales archaeon]|nr:hypothetical protein [Thermoplasmatales archaeon]